MMPPAVRIGGAFVLVLFCAWAGARIYWLQHPGAAAIPVPAGSASSPNSEDLTSELSAEVPGTIKIPEHLPAFALADLSGKLTPISTWQGKSLVLNFWATWCGPCRREIPLLQTLAGEWAADEVAVIGIAVDYPDKVQQYRDQLKIAYPLLVGEQDALDTAAKLGMASPAFPFTVFTDRRGEVVALFLGELHRPQADLIMAAVRDLNRGRVQLPQARSSIAAGLDALAEKNPAG